MTTKLAELEKVLQERNSQIEKVMYVIILVFYK
jgi:hypothetical protein